MTELATALLLGIIEGLTEFIPVSSTGHLILLVDLLGFEGPPGRVFEIVIQFGAILAVCWLYRAKLLSVFAGLISAERDAYLFSRNLLFAFLPAALIGVQFHQVIKTALFSPLVVSVALIVGGILIILIEKRRPTPTIATTEALGWKRALAIGFCQALAMIPGTSRSGATIMGALLFRMERKAAAEFSFFLAIPTMLAAATYDTYKNWHQLDASGMEVIGVGFVSAFIVALLVVKHVVDFISRHGFIPFAWYRIAVGSTMLVLLYAS
jgi:undecaprenyl-diphosphatase